MDWLNNLTLRRRLGLLVLVGLMVGLGLFSWLGIQSVNESVQRTLQERLIIARVMANQLDESMTHVLLHLQNAAVEIGGLFTREQFVTRADSLRRILAESGLSVHKVVLISGDGRALQIVPEKSGIISTDMSRHPTVVKTLREGLATISNVESSLLADVPVVLISTPVYNEEAKTVGALTILVDIEQSSISTSGQTVILGKTGYTEIVDGNGIILDRSSPASSPDPLERSDHPGRFAMLISQGKETVRTCHRCHETEETLERRRDVLAFAPLATTSWGVAVRQPEEEALAPTTQLKQKLLLLGLVVVFISFLLAWIMVRGIVTPVRILTSAAQRVAAGDFRAAIPVKRRDEIGQLGAAFNSMTRELANSRQELTKSRDELMVRNEELSALNSIAGTANQSLNLRAVLGNTMRKVLEVTRTSTGCVFLRGDDGHKLEMISGSGASDIFRCPQSGSATADCACHQVLRHGQTLMVNDVSQCPMLTEDRVRRENISSFVSVPLKAKDKTLGTMNIACSSQRFFVENDFRLLESIAYHVGLAVENAALYEAAKQKEELRGQLLSSVINAQEEERKRIARELHDEHGQALTALKIDMESLENMTEPQQTQLREKLKNAGALVVGVLENLRRLTLDLRPYVLDRLGLTAAIRTYARTHLEPKGIQVTFQTRGLSQRLAPEVETSLFRIVQEAIHNIIRHAEAHNVGINLTVQDSKMTAVVEDDGKGFDVAAFFRSRFGAQSLGLLGIQERLALLGGTLNIQSRLGEGTRIIVEIPLARSPAESGPLKAGRNFTVPPGNTARRNEEDE